MLARLILLCLLAWVALLFPGKVVPDRTVAPEQLASEWFSQERIHTFQVRLGRPQAALLRETPRRYVTGLLRVDGTEFGPIGIHLKGKGSFQGLDQKPSFTLDLERFKEPPDHADSAATGVTKIHLNNSAEDGSFLREWVGARLFSAAGVPAPRVAHAWVELNQRPLGLYVLKEGFDRGFLQRSFGCADGQLWELQDGCASEGESSGSELRELRAAVAEPDLAARWQRMSKALDVERFISMVAAEVATCHWDGYALAWNNFRVYYDPPKDKLVFLPTGMDQLFGNPKLDWRPGMAGPVARAVLETAEGGKRYRVRLVELLRDEAFSPDALIQRVEQRLRLLASVLTRRELAAARTEANTLCAQIRERHAHLSACGMR